jgi:hypothetical protein
MAAPQPVPLRQAEPPQPQRPPAIEPEPPTTEAEPANSLLAGLVGSGLEWLLDLVWPDWHLPGLPGLLELPGVGLPASEPPATPATEVSAPAAAEAAGVGPAPTAAPTPAGVEEAPARPAAEPAPTLGEPEPGEPGPPAAAGEAPVVPGQPTAAAGPPLTAADIRARARAAAAALPHPAGPRADEAAAPIEQAAGHMVARNERRAEVMAAEPARLAGPAPAHRAVPRPDPGPIPNELAAVQKLIGRRLDSASLPPVTRSPRGTLPDVTLPALTPLEIRAVLLDKQGITEFASGTDPASTEEREKLLQVRATLGAKTAAAPPVPIQLPFMPALVLPTSAPVVDEPVVKVGVPEGQRALFAGVVSELRSDPNAQAQKVLQLVRVNHAKFPGGALEQAFSKPLDAGLLPTVTQTLAGEVDALATALALTPEELAAAMTDRQNEVQRLKEAAVAAALNRGFGGLLPQVVTSHARVQATVQATAWAANQAVAADKAVRRHPSRTQARVERTMAELREPVAVELARLDEQLRQRERAIADAVRVQVSAIRLAQTRDEIALTPKDPAQEHTQDRLWRRDVRVWADAAVAELSEGEKSVQARLVADARAQTRRYRDELEAAATAALAALKAWGDKHVRSTEVWWTELEGQLETWAKSAEARTTLWATQQGHASRLALLQDIDSMRHLSALQSAKSKQEADAYVARLDTESRTFLSTFAGNAQAGAPDLAGALAAAMRQRVQAHHQAEWEEPLEKAVLNLPETEDNYDPMRSLLRLVQPNWNLEAKIGQIHSSVTRYRGFDEEAIFEALADLTPLAAKMLRWGYERAWEQSLDDALHGYGHVGHLSDNELKTADSLLSGSRVEGAIGAIHSAISGPGAEMGAVNRIMRSLTPEERLRVVELYPKRYDGVTLESDLNSQWSVSRSEVAETMQIAQNDLVGASATALQRSVKTVYVGGGGYGGDGGMDAGERIAVIDRDDAVKVYGQIRQEVEAEASRHGWITAQVEAEITFRSQELGAKFDEQAAKEWWAQREPGTTPTEAAFALASPAGRDLLNGLATNDQLKIDVARIQLEDEGVYADDAALNLLFQDQATRSMQEAQRDHGPFLSAQTERQLDAEEPFPTEEMRTDRRMQLEREKNAELQKLADEQTRGRMERLDAAYHMRSGRSLETMVEDNMSFTSKEEGLARVRAKGVLTNYQKLRFSIEGLGTNLPMLRSTLGSMSKQELGQADEQWRKDHGESLIDAIEGDTSGRDQGDLVDMAKHGAPQTAFELYDAARRKYNRDRAGETGLGAWLTSSETDYATRELTHLQKSYQKLRTSGESREDQRRAGLAFEIALDRADMAIELQRQALDSVADALANAAAIAAAFVAGAVLSLATGGASLGVAAAVIGSIVATGTSIAVKSAIKGSAYGHEEFYTDLAVGAVDLAVAYLTAGLGNALLGRGGATAIKGAEQAGLTRLLARLGNQGLLVRKLGDIAILKGFEESRYLVVKLIGRGTSQVIEQLVQAVPTSLTGALLNEQLYRQPGGPQRLIDDTIAGTVHSTVMGLGVAGGLHLGGMAGRSVGRLGSSLFGHIGRLMVPDLGVPRLGEVRPIAGDILGRAGTPRERLAEFGEWRKRNPEGTLRDFTAERTARLGEELHLAGAERERIRQARRELLAGLPPSERGQYADLPIRSVSEADFARLTGNKPGHARLLVEQGRAVLLLREGGAPGAVAALLPAVRKRVFPGTYGLTVESLLPPHLRDTPVGIDHDLPRQEIRVIATPATGPITGVEMRVGPGTHPVDVGLHAGEITRVRRWMGRLGDARMAVARFGEKFGRKPVTPADRTRFEAAGEVGKLGPIIEERIRRGLAISDPAAAAAHDAHVLRLLTQLERSRRILTGELVAEPRGYVAQEGEPTGTPAAAPPDPAKAIAALSKLRDKLPKLEQALAKAEFERGAVDATVKRLYTDVKAHRDVLGLLFPAHADIAKIDLTTGQGVAQLRQAIRTMVKGQKGQIWWRGVELDKKLIRYESALKGQPEAQRRWDERLGNARQAYDKAHEDTQRWFQLLAKDPKATAAALNSKNMRLGVLLSSLLPAPRAPQSWLPKILAGDTIAKQLKHFFGGRAEYNMANRIAEDMRPRQTVVEYGDKLTTHGADTTSVDEAGWPYLWDSKYRSGGEQYVKSDTFSVEAYRKNARDKAIDAVLRNPDGRLSAAQVATAVANLTAGNFTMYVVTSADASTFHSCVKIESRNDKVGPSENVRVPWNTAK